jgi:hypothetical protein
MERPANVTGMVREIFRQYLEGVREIVVVTGRCFQRPEFVITCFLIT